MKRRSQRRRKQSPSTATTSSTTPPPPRPAPPHHAPVTPPPVSMTRHLVQSELPRRSFAKNSMVERWSAVSDMATVVCGSASAAIVRAVLS